MSLCGTYFKAGFLAATDFIKYVYSDIAIIL